MAGEVSGWPLKTMRRKPYYDPRDGPRKHLEKSLPSVLDAQGATAFQKPKPIDVLDSSTPCGDWSCLSADSDTPVSAHPFRWAICLPQRNRISFQACLRSRQAGARQYLSACWEIPEKERRLFQQPMSVSQRECFNVNQGNIPGPFYQGDSAWHHHLRAWIAHPVSYR